MAQLGKAEKLKKGLSIGVIIVSQCRGLQESGVWKIDNYCLLNRGNVKFKKLLQTQQRSPSYWRNRENMRSTFAEGAAMISLLLIICSSICEGAGFGKPAVGKPQAAVPPPSTASKGFVLRKTGAPTTAQFVPTLNLDSFPSSRMLHADPPVFEIPNFFSQQDCADYIALAGHPTSLESQSAAYSNLSKRTSTTWYLPYKQVHDLLARAELLTGVQLEHFEEPQIVRYEIGQQFSWHEDALPAPVVKAAGAAGNRVATLLVYLNSLPSSAGGATCFQHLNLQVRPEAGKALLFFPCFADGKSDERTLHCGQVAGDTKWIAQIWVRQGQYLPTVPPGNSHIPARAAVDQAKRN